MDERQQRKHWSGTEIAGVLRRVLVGKEEISRVCEEVGCCPSQVYRWQRELFERGAELFERPARKEEGELRAVREQAAALEVTLRRKDAVLAELMEEHVRLKKTLGGA